MLPAAQNSRPVEQGITPPDDGLVSETPRYDFHGPLREERDMLPGLRAVIPPVFAMPGMEKCGYENSVMTRTKKRFQVYSRVGQMFPDLKARQQLLGLARVSFKASGEHVPGVL